MWARLNPAHIPKEVEAVVLETTALNCPCTLNIKRARFTYVFKFSYFRFLNIKYCQIVHTHVVKSGFRSDLFVQTSVVDMYVQCSQLGFAYNVFARMPHRDVASWNSMILVFA